jgi:uncharacterized membrane protein
LGKKKMKIKAEGGQNISDKKAAVMGKSKKEGSKSTFMGVAIALVIIAIAGFVVLGGGSGPGGFSVVSAEAGLVKIPIGDVSDRMAHYYTYKASNGKDVNFFVLKSSDGVIRAAFDACDVCYREKKGYRQEGDVMVCNNCGQRFPSTKINEIKGGCNPAPLGRIVDGNMLVINSNDIEQGAWYF